ncbi:hypothetical protein ACM9HF_04395 [Colwellia sp. RE-S-Sl-9]
MGKFEYANHGLKFNLPEKWQVVDDDIEEPIRAVTIECDESGSCWSDIYQAHQAPEISQYINKQVQHFVNELPDGYEVDGEIKTERLNIKHSHNEYQGFLLMFNVSIPSGESIGYENMYFKLNTGEKVSMLSSQYTEDERSPILDGIKIILESYSSV